MISGEFPVSKSARIYAVIAPHQPPRLFSLGNRKNRPSKTGLAGQRIAKNVRGRVKMPIRQHVKTTIAMIENA